ncbi:MAG: hypothetical protein IT426_16895 [Pirellulales bacterium]|nr:hypothetical protein [Pirellulales bacterium]
MKCLRPFALQSRSAFAEVSQGPAFDVRKCLFRKDMRFEAERRPETAPR